MLFRAGGFGGRDVVSRIAKLAPEVRAVALRSCSVDPAMSDPHAHGCATQLARPCTIDDLAKVVKDARLAGEQSAGTGAGARW